MIREEKSKHKYIDDGLNFFVSKKKATKKETRIGAFRASESLSMTQQLQQNRNQEQMSDYNIKSAERMSVPNL